MKTCKKCGTPKPFESYTTDTRYKDGYYPWCFECRREWRQNRKDRQRELQANWRDQNRDHVQKEAMKWYYDHRDQELEKRRARQRYRWHNDPVYRARKNREKRERYHADPNLNRRMRAWAFITTHRRRARIKGSDTRFTQAEWRALCEGYSNRCLRCGEQKPLSPDHVVPISCGGTNDIANIQPLCADCNAWKGAKTIDFRPGRSGD